MDPTTPPLRLEAYQASRPAIFPSMDSLKWFCRQHRATLISRGAIISPTGRKLIVPAVFDQVVIEVGRARAEADAQKNYRTERAGGCV